MKINRVILFICISFILSVLDFYGFLNFARDPLEKIIIPLKSGIYEKETALVYIANGISRLPENLAINSRLNSVLTQNEEMKQKVSFLTEENMKLREQLGSPLPPSYKFIPAKVIAVSRYMEIAVGKNDNVKENMFVITGNNLIGKIVDTTAHRSNVELVNSTDFSVPVKTERGTRGNLTGKNGSSQVLEKILQKDPLFLDDQVWTSGDGGFPPGLLLGKIIHIDSEDVSAYKGAQVQPATDINSLDNVFVIQYI